MNTEYSFFVGIDVSKRKLDLALLHEGKIRSKVIENSPRGYADLQDWLVAHGAAPAQTHLCLEATGPYGDGVATALADAHWPVSVVNPARIKGFAQIELARNKNDRADAALLARFCAALNPALWQAPSVQWRELRAKVERLQVLKEMHQQESNRLEAHQASQEALQAKSVSEHLAWLDKKIAALETDIDDHIDRHPELKQDAELIESIPGIARTTAAKVLAYLGDVRRFHSAKALAAYVGVCPRERVSGSSVRGRTMISRAGNASIRHALYMPGMVALRHNPILKTFGERLLASGHAPKAVIGAAMRKLVHMIYGIVRSGEPFRADFCSQKLDFQDGI